MMMMLRSARRPIIALALFGVAACSRDAVPRLGDGLDVSAQPTQFREDYAIFANRCSKCHGLSRPLNLASRNTSDEFWERYVERMRRQSGSGISPEDAVVIRRFLHVYSRLVAKARREESTPDAADVAADASSSPPAIGAAPNGSSAVGNVSSPTAADPAVDGGSGQ